MLAGTLQPPLLLTCNVLSTQAHVQGAQAGRTADSQWTRMLRLAFLLSATSSSAWLNAPASVVMLLLRRPVQSPALAAAAAASRFQVPLEMAVTSTVRLMRRAAL